MTGLTGEKTIRVVTTSTDMPFSYIKDGKNVGYDIDLVVRFCRYAGYGLELGDVDFGARIAAVQSGKYDFSTDMNVTEERREQVLFSDPTSNGGVVLAILNEHPVALNTLSTGIAQLNGKRIGVQTGTTFDAIVLESLPDAKISYFNSYPDMAAALEANKIDGFPGDEPVIRLMASENGRLSILPGRMDSFEFGFVLPKTAEGKALQTELDAWIANMRESGELEKTMLKWTEGEDAQKTLPDYASFPAPKGTLRLATEGAYAPMNYFREKEVVGMEIDLAAQFCEANGYGLTVEAMNFDGILPAIQAGKADFGAAGISITEERKESVNFSTPYYTGGTVMAVLKREDTVPIGVYTSISQLNGKRIGVQTGTSFDEAISKLLPDAKVSYYNTKADLINALLTYKIDGYTADEPVVKTEMLQHDRLTYVPKYMESFEFAYVFPKTEAGQALCDQFSEYLRTIRQDGTMKEIESKWFSEDDSQKSIADYKSFPAANGTLRMATEALYEPFVYIMNNQIVGYDVDIAARFCEAYGYGLDIVDMSFDAVLPAVQTGKCDFGGSGIAITEERAESVLFSEPNFTGGTVIAVLKADESAGKESFWDGIVSSFDKTFLREKRWQLFLEGVGTTLLITALSILFGTALGFLVFMLCRRQSCCQRYHPLLCMDGDRHAHGGPADDPVLYRLRQRGHQRNRCGGDRIYADFWRGGLRASENGCRHYRPRPV